MSVYLGTHSWKNGKKLHGRCYKIGAGCALPLLRQLDRDNYLILKISCPVQYKYSSMFMHRNIQSSILKASDYHNWNLYVPSGPILTL